MDNQIFFIFYNLAHQYLFLDKLIVFFAQIFPYIVIILAGIFLLLHHEVFYSKNPIRELIQKWQEIVLVFLSGISAWCIAAILKIFIHTARPFNFFTNVVPLMHPTDYSFPSGHSTFFIALALAIFFYHKKIGYYFIFFAILIGLARIMAGVHFPIDILGGYIIGILTAYFIKFLYQRIYIKR
ncbi:MAG: phosphatase PAP2 family protein [Candidatus Paceibacterota bacterium]